ncbi:hypothetical protein B0H11DRAFT_2223703 [Mycena galericulata]|nr:hypothetical protein B0H11DRAFT_2223703 [Mycena galericulata]
MAHTHPTGQHRFPLNDLPLDLFLPTPRPGQTKVKRSPTKRRILAEETFATPSSPDAFCTTISTTIRDLGPRTMSPTQGHLSKGRTINIASPPAMARFAESPDPFLLSTDKRDLIKTPTKQQSVSDIPSPRSTVPIPHQSPSASRWLYFELPTRSPTASLIPSVRPLATSDTFAASESALPRAQSIHYPGFDVFLDNMPVHLEALHEELNSIPRPGRDHDEEKENMG